VTPGPTPPVHIEISPVDPAHADAAWCLDRYFDELDRRFVGGFDRSLGAGEGGNAYVPPYGVFVLACTLDRPVGCGGVTFVAGDFAEIKRMWVSEDVRGQGIGRRILAALEDRAREAGHSVVRLDSNGALPDAHALYRRNCYADIARYNDNPYAHVWFEKNLTGAQ